MKRRFLLRALPRFLCAGCAVFLWVLLSCGILAARGAGELPQTARAFIEEHCIECHDADAKKGGLDLMDEAKIAQRTRLELAILGVWGGFVRKLKQTTEDRGSLLDRTMVLLTSNLGNASSHASRNMPVVLAGGGFRHGQHLAFDREQNYPLPNLYVSMLQRLGLEADTFATSTSTMRGLDLA